MEPIVLWFTQGHHKIRLEEVENLKIVEASHLMDINKLDFNDVVIHAPYIINLANPDPEKREFAVNFFS